MVTPTSLITTHRMLKDTGEGEDLAQLNQGVQHNERDRKRLEEACAEFESLFIYNVLKQMRQTIIKSELTSGGKGEEIFTSMMDEELSKQISVRQGLGLREVLIEQLTGERGKNVSQSMVAHTYRKNPGSEEGWQPLVLPVVGRISSPYGWRNDPFTGERDFHCGIDIASPFGSGVYVAGTGRVVFCGWKKGYGEVIEVEHPDGLHTLYAHNAKSLVKEGEKVEKHQVIALVGNSGRSTGPHLHFEVRKHGESIDPRVVTRINKDLWYAHRF